MAGCCAYFLYLKGGANYDKIGVSKETKGIHMKKMMKKFNFALIGIMASMPAFAAGAAGGNSGLCVLITQMKGVFGTLRTLAFVGAAFVIAGWAWGYISKGEVKKDDLKDKGIGMMVGFIMLFGIGIILSFLMSASGGKTLGCDITGQW